MIKRIYLKCDPAVSCWLDSYGQAWQIVCSKKRVDETRDALRDGLKKCPRCGKRFSNVHPTDIPTHLRMHMLNDCPKR